MLLVLWDPQNRLDFATLQGSVYCMQRRGGGELSHKTHSDTAGLGLTPGNKTDRVLTQIKGELGWLPGWEHLHSQPGSEATVSETPCGESGREVGERGGQASGGTARELLGTRSLSTSHEGTFNHLICTLGTTANVKP